MKVVYSKKDDKKEHENMFDLYLEKLEIYKKEHEKKEVEEKEEIKILKNN